MDLVLTGGRVIDTSGAEVFDGVADVRIAGGVVAEIGRGLAPHQGARSIDCRDLVVCAGLIDLHTHLREPGQEYKEDIATGTRAAAAGGFTTVCCMPNTNPVNDDRTVTELIVRRAREVGSCRVRPIGAVTRGLEGKSLADIADMREGGIVAISDDGRPVWNAGVMRRALEYARTFDLPLVQHAEEPELVEGGAMNEGPVATRIGLRGQPSITESSMVARDLELVEWTGARYHVAHVSAARTVALVRDAKKRGLPVTCEVTPHHVALTDDACASYDPATKVMPPLRGAPDVAALIAALADGTIDAIATDHAPHSLVEKEVEFECAAPGMLGLETAVPLVLALVEQGALPFWRAIQLLTSGPARCFALLDGRGAGRMAQGVPADVTVIDPARRWTFDPAQSASKSRNTPFAGMAMKGRAVLTIVGGRITHDLDGRCA
jgi:dihydroorotase